MLYDPKCEAATKTRGTKLMTVDGLIAWLETKPYHETYDYIDISGCLIAQYLRAHHFPSIVSPTSAVGAWFYVIPWVQFIPEEMNEVALQRPHTFGAALSRARKAAGQ